MLVIHLLVQGFILEVLERSVKITPGIVVVFILSVFPLPSMPC